jgi:hypothetical protein
LLFWFLWQPARRAIRAKPSKVVCKPVVLMQIGQSA